MWGACFLGLLLLAYALVCLTERAAASWPSIGKLHNSSQ